MATNYGEIFCQATEQLIQNALAGQKYDVTKDCTVVAVPKKKDGLYSVSDGSITFDAYAAAGASYVKGDQVLVTIPQGDWNKQKTIINKIITDMSGGINYQNPMQNFIKGTGNLMEVQNGSIEANGDTTIKTLYTMERSDGTYFGFKKIAIQGAFKTDLSGLNLVHGQYGIKLFVYGDNIDQSVAELTWSASDMLGNPYEFSTYFKQEAVFELPETINTITRIDVALYQDGNFCDGNNNLFNPLGLDNIFVRDLELYLGFQSSYDSKEVLEIAGSNLEFTTTDNIRHLALRWFHEVIDRVYESVEVENWDPTIYEIRWYQYDIGCDKEYTDEYGGHNWRWLNRNGEPELTHADYPFILPVSLLPSRPTEKFKAIGLVTSYPLINDPTYKVVTHYTSNVITFTNVDKDMTGGNGETIPADTIKKTFSLHFDDNSYGNYFMYDQNNILINSAKEGPSKQRSVTIFANGVELNKDYTGYNHIDYIKWEVPSNYSMITCGEVQGFENPNPNLITHLNTAVAFTGKGSFDYESYVQVPQNGFIKTILWTTADLQEWNSLISYTASVSEGLNHIKNVFALNRDYSYIKLTMEYYDSEDSPLDSNLIQVDRLLFKLQSTFFTNELIPQQDGENLIIDNKLWYSIANNWNQSRNNNTIKCKISVAGVETVLIETLRFGKQGTSGTQNTFLLEMLDGKNALSTTDKELKIEACLIGENGKQIYFDNAEDVTNRIEWSLLGYDNIASAPIEIRSTDKQQIIKLELKDNISLDANYSILQAKYKYEVADTASNTTPYLYAFLPIPIKDESAISMVGATQVIYNHLGVPQCSNQSYCLYLDDQELIEGWKLNQPVQPINKLTLVNSTYGSGGLVLNPPALYSRGSGQGPIYDRACVYCEYDGAILWSQPILIMQSQYDFAMLNSWDGNLTIDENNGIILSTMIGAGKKDNENRFSGVLIGDIKEGTNLEDTEKMTGVYGFHEGVISYGFKEDGTAFLGKYDNGRIVFDGNSAIIKSTDENGMIIDLDDGKISANKFALSAGTDETGTITISNDLFSIKKGSNEIKLDLIKNKFIIASENFNLAEDGSVTLAGTVTATGGTIGGCEIKDGVLEVPAANITGQLTAKQVDASIITTENFSAQQINADQITAGTVKANNIDVPGLIQNGNIVTVTGNFSGTLSAASGTFGNLTANGNLYMNGKRIYFQGQNVNRYFEYNSSYGSYGAAVFTNVNVYTPTVYAYTMGVNGIYPLGHSGVGFPGAGNSFLTLMGTIRLDSLGGNIKKDSEGYLYI